MPGVLRLHGVDLHLEGVAMIFPGMDPYLEDPILWPGVHNAFLVRLHDDLNEHLDPRYVARLEERVYLEGPERQIIPDVHVHISASNSPGSTVAVAPASETLSEPIHVAIGMLEIREPYLEIIDLKNNKRVVTVIELLSPTNKASGNGRDDYLRKQQEVRQSSANLVEIDLLRGGLHTVVAPERKVRRLRPYHYLVCVNRAIGIRDDAEVYPIPLSSPLPNVRIPLDEGEEDIRADLDSLLSKTYKAGRYLNEIDYSRPCVPPLNEVDAAWAAQQIAKSRKS